MEHIMNHTFSMSVMMLGTVKLKEQVCQIMTVSIHVLIRYVQQVSASMLVLVLEVLLSCCGHLPHHVQRDMLNELVDGLCHCSVQRELIRLNVEIAVQLTHHLVDSKKEAGKKVKSWTGDILQVRCVFFSNILQVRCVIFLRTGCIYWESEKGT